MRTLWIKAITTIVALTFSVALSLAAEPAKKTTTVAKPEATKPAENKKSAAKQELVDINSASDTELKAIPGLGDAYIAKIVVNRPYANKTQLVSKKVLPESVYEKIKDKIIAKQAKKDDKKAAAKPEPKKK
ncbi:MAG: helix-hairpin-helix domain-containing protein [Trichlorobacter sp.]|uniref:ComEA family DNA-binding protein n=1 Tax=Trichlorobacter sp. TaxID=2911007 RepID=UPI00256A6DA8|nr:helix-hairpin-helix domain-containing protein [Trichlorobacter sp.]MDK9716990.1 helix-hairpin-helix domain-containing protein [Trichlorobacter sp.]